MQFHDEPCAIKDYINKRLSKSDLETIINCTNLTVDPTSYALLQKAQPTSAAVERSFSMLNKLLRKDRNFDVKNVKKYMMLYSTSSIIRTSFIRYSIIRPLGQIILNDVIMKRCFHNILLKPCQLPL